MGCPVQRHHPLLPTQTTTTSAYFPMRLVQEQFTYITWIHFNGVPIIHQMTSQATPASTGHVELMCTSEYIGYRIHLFLEHTPQQHATITYIFNL